MNPEWNIYFYLFIYLFIYTSKDYKISAFNFNKSLNLIWYIQMLNIP